MKRTLNIIAKVDRKQVDRAFALLGRTLTKEQWMKLTEAPIELDLDNLGMIARNQLFFTLVCTVVESLE